MDRIDRMSEHSTRMSVSGRSGLADATPPRGASRTRFRRSSAALRRRLAIRHGPCARCFAHGARLARCMRSMLRIVVIAITGLATARAWADPADEPVAMPEPDHRVGLSARTGGISDLSGDQA